jgi:acyl carrier protein
MDAAAEDAVKSMLAEILEIEKTAIGEDTGPANVSTWDSLNSLRIANALENAFKIQFTMEEIQGMNTYAKIRDTINGLVKARGY